MWHHWQDYIAIIPGAAAVIMGAVAFGARELPAWKRITAIVLTAIAIGATGYSSYWVQQQKNIADARRTAIIETLGKLIGEGQNLMNGLSGSPPPPLPTREYTEWLQRTNKFLRTVGPSFAIRFMSDAGLQTNFSPSNMDQIHAAYWDALRMRLTRLHEFSAEFVMNISRAN
jgi:hypothetical protein